MKPVLSRILVSCLVVAAVVATSPGLAGARVDPPRVTPIADGLVAPLQIAAENNNWLVAQNFAGLLSRHRPDGTVEVVAEIPGGEIAGVDVGPKGIYYTGQTYDADGHSTSAGLFLKTKGPAKMIADLQAFEVAHNPDGGVEYGFRGISDDCASQLPDFVGPATYFGIVETHPYAVAARGKTVYVADAAGNSILQVAPNNSVSTLAVLPAQPVLVTADIAAALGLPDCVVGLTYWFEPVPTDIEVGPNGLLYVTTLPGGPEDASLGARGAVWAIHPGTGAIRMVIGGLFTPTNLAIGPQRTIYVTELFAYTGDASPPGRIVRIQGQNVISHVELPLPAAIEFHNGRLVTGFNVFDDGMLAEVTR